METTHNLRKRNKIYLVLLGVVLIMSTGGCATTGPKYSTVRHDIATLSKEQGRIIFYRPDTLFGAAMRPDIFLDGRKVGQSRRGTVFYVNAAPGKHQIKVPAVMYPGATRIDIELAQNEIVYVKTFIGGSSFVGRTKVEVVSSEQAATDEIDNLVFIIEPLD